MYASLRMRLSLDWLSQFIEFTETDPQIIADAVTAHVAEVDEVEQQGSLLSHCCVGKILSIAKHPDADRLSVCTVQTDKGTKPIVCGGTNLREGMRIAFAHVGATVKWQGGEMATLESVKIRGEKSEGMICAAEELELADLYPPKPEDGNRPVIDLGDGDDGVGKSLREYLGLTDTILHIDNHAITHRADLFSQVGFARECVAMGIATWKHKPEYPEPAFAKDPLPFTIHVEDKKLVPRYCACLLAIDNIGETPAWMVRRLEAGGWRSVSLPVDITNFVTTEVGMPLHSFDADDLKGDIRMRASKKGEKITTLDKVERTLPDGSIVLSDDEGIFDLLGVMGGLRSSTKKGTKHIFLHSACVDPASIRKTVIATGHRTDAATVYEKGIPPVTVRQGFLRAVELFLELVPGARIVSAMDSWGDDGVANPITVSSSRVNAMLGTDIPVSKMTDALSALEFSVQEKKGDITATPPLHRLGDIRGPHDLIEEIGRIYGLNAIEPVMPFHTVALPERDFRLHYVRRGLKEQGYFEFLPLSLLGADLLTKCGLDASEAVEILNPIGAELSLLQPSALPRLLEHAEQNIKRAGGELRTFHHGTVFTNGADCCKALGALRASRSAKGLLQTPFYALKQDLTFALNAAGYELSVAKESVLNPAAHPGRSTGIAVGDTLIGSLFELHPGIITDFDLPERTAVALLDLSVLFAMPATVTVAQAVPLYPAVTYDETVPYSHENILRDALEKACAGSDLIESVEVADLFAKEGTTYNLTLRCTYRAPDRTLTEEEAKKLHAQVMKQFA